MEFKILKSGDLEDLEELVNKYLAEGWRPQGPIFESVAAAGVGRWSCEFIQYNLPISRVVKEVRVNLHNHLP